MNKTRLTDEEVIAAARFASPEEMTQDPHERMLIELSCYVAEKAGKDLKLVVWPNGVAAMVDGDPANREAWNRLLVKSFRSATSGRSGPVMLDL